MRVPTLIPGALLGISLLLSGNLQAGEGLRRLNASTDTARATLRVRTNERSAYPIPRNITGKFAEHLGFNIYNGMDAQILRNATFADYPFGTGEMSPDGVVEFQTDDRRIEQDLRGQARRFGWPESELDGLVQAHRDALACFWTRIGSRDEVEVSPDVGPYGGRAQRVEVKAAGQGIGQWTWLPLHRQRQYQFELMARSPEVKSLTVSFREKGSGKPVASVQVEGLSSQWEKFNGKLVLPAEVPAESSCEFTITADAPGQFVLRHVFVRPADHVNGADPDIVRLLKDSHLPLLRWPGGNFVSTYHWQDGVGPLEQRPTKPNYAWGAVEPNTFGTAEFVTFCRAAGCEPFICINAGSGTPEEAAQWIEYCNGPITSPMGRLRAAHGYPEPFPVRHWEVGNELWGHWQMYWTTAQGYVDRYQQFAQAMLAVDPKIQLYACGAPAMSGKRWNDILIAGVGRALSCITDHPLIGGDVSPSVEPMDVYRDFMAVPEVLQQKWVELKESMRQRGLDQPKLAVTELQLFAHIGKRTDTNVPVRLTYQRLPGQGSIAEAIYDVLIYHAAVRLAPFVDLITHSAVVNHGGGLRKERERVWANPCHYAQAAFSSLADAVPVAVEIEAAAEAAPLVLPDLKKATPAVSFSAVDALAAVGTDGSLWLSIVHRGSSGPIRLNVDIPEFKEAKAAAVRTLTASEPWAGNTLEQPDAVRPVDSVIIVTDGKFGLDLPPYTVLRVRVAGKT